MASTRSQRSDIGYSEGIICALQQRTAAADATHLLPYIKPTSRILDVGCGSGSITVSFAQIATRGYVIGVDISVVSLVLAEKHADDVRSKAASQPGTLGVITFQELDVLKGLPFGDDSFDIVYSGQTFVHLLSGDEGLARATRVMREIHRVVKPGGVVATRDACAYHWYPSSHTIGREQSFEKLIKAMTGTAKPPGGDVPIVYRKAGFDPDKMTISASTRVISGREKREWLGKMALQRSVGSGQRENFVKEGNTEDEFEELQAMLQKWMDDEDAWHIGIHTDVLAFK